MLSDLSARFIVVSPEEIDREIEQALKQILDFFQADRCGLLHVLKDSAKLTHIVLREGIPWPDNIDLFPATRLPWVFKKIVERHEVVAFNSLREMPAEASIDKIFYEAMGTKSNLNIPVVISRSEVFSLFINAVRNERRWPDVYIPRLRVLGEILGSAIERSRSDRELNERLH
ncbi:MAG: GAF domain-containing protein, partial [Syntrophales bacterium LBB04]|nr:GAF domain-containing protein [Syntrophales bacterium LBB04]